MMPLVNLPALMPRSLANLSPEELESEAELFALRRLELSPLKVAALKVVPAVAEDIFYKLNNLPAQLSELFESLDPLDPDEDDLEELSPRAMQLVRSHYLLDEFIDLFYESLTDLPAELELRRPQTADAHRALKGRPALMALKTIWSGDWSFGALQTRVAGQASIALDGRPVIIGPVTASGADEPTNRTASELLGREVDLWLDGVGAILRVGSATLPDEVTR